MAPGVVVAAGVADAAGGELASLEAVAVGAGLVGLTALGLHAPKTMTDTSSVAAAEDVGRATRQPLRPVVEMLRMMNLWAIT